MTESLPRIRRLLLPLALCALCALAACGGSPDGQAESAAQAAAARQPATLGTGGVRISASLAPTAALSPAIAQRYGVDRERRSQLLLVGLREGPEDAETPVQARVTARARDLRGVWQDVAMRELRSEGFIDYVGTVRVDPPDTLSLEISVQRSGAETPELLRFSREVFAQ